MTIFRIRTWSGTIGPTVWKTWGVAQGINVGDALREMAQMALDRAQEAGAPAATVLAAQRRLNRAALEMIEGQYLDLRFEHEADVPVDAYLDMIARKTGAMMGCSLALGGILAGADTDLVARMDRAGRRLGSASRFETTIWASGATAPARASPVRTTSAAARRPIRW